MNKQVLARTELFVKMSRLHRMRRRHLAIVSISCSFIMADSRPPKRWNACQRHLRQKQRTIIIYDQMISVPNERRNQDHKTFQTTFTRYLFLSLSLFFSVCVVCCMYIHMITSMKKTSKRIHMTSMMVFFARRMALSPTANVFVSTLSAILVL